MIPLLEGWPTKAKEAPSPHEVWLTPLDTNPLFQCLDYNNDIDPLNDNLDNNNHVIDNDNDPPSFINDITVRRKAQHKQIQEDNSMNNQTNDNKNGIEQTLT